MILITAATPWEANPIIAAWGLKPRRETACPAYEGQVGTQRVLLLKTGIGRIKTAKAIEKMEDREVSLAISVGFAGALQPGIHSGDLVADLRGVPVEITKTARHAAEKLGLPLHFGMVHTTDRVLSSPADKQDAGIRHRAVAVDMESSVLREWCRPRGYVFAAVRVVLDTVEDRLPSEPCGDDDPQALVSYAARHWKDMPLLIGVGWRQRRAMKRLVDFLNFWIRMPAMPGPTVNSG